MSCELRFHGESNGWEAQFLQRGELHVSRSAFTTRAAAVAWADDLRKAMESETWSDPLPPVPILWSLSEYLDRSIGSCSSSCVQTSTSLRRRLSAEYCGLAFTPIQTSTAVTRLLRILFAKRRARGRAVAIVTALVAGLFAAMALDDAGVSGAAPYVLLLILSASYVVRPMLFSWAVVFGAFAVFTVLVASHPESGIFSDWIVFMALGGVPVLLLWFARPRQLTPGNTPG